MEKGYVQVYTGNGKGKTTAMLGLTLRAVGAEKKVYIGQFLKDDEYSEIKAIKNFLPSVTVEQYGAGKGFVKKDGDHSDDKKYAQNGLKKACEALKSGIYDIVILDEINVVGHFKLIEEKKILELIQNKPENVELILTGRYACQEVIDMANLCTEMKEIKHYYSEGVIARAGIEK